MYCNNCGTENEKETKFCVKCGKELGKKGEGLGTASMILGIISIVLSFIITVVTLPLSITGLILGIVNKAKGGKKISGIVLNTISIFLSIVLIFVYLLIGIGIFSAVISDPKVRKELENLERDIDRYSSTNYVEGEYNCKNFDGNGATGSYIVRFELDDDMNFMWGKYGDTYNNYVKGSYTYKDLSKKDPSGKFSYYNIKLDGDVFYKDGVKQTEPYASEYEFGITKDNGKKQGIMMNTKTYNMYYCYED